MEAVIFSKCREYGDFCQTTWFCGNFPFFFAISHEWLQKYLISTECNLQLISQFKHKKSFSINLLLHISRTLLLTQQSACMCLFRDHKDTVVSFMYVAAFQLMFILLFIFFCLFPANRQTKQKKNIYKHSLPPGLCGGNLFTTLRCPQRGLSSQSLGKYWQLNQSNQHTSTYSRIQQQTKNP